MPKHEIEIVIDEDAKVEATVKGIVGKGCEKVIKFLKDVGRIISHKNTPDMYKRDKRTYIKQLTT